MGIGYMWLIPYSSFTLYTSAEPEELVRRLRTETVRERPYYWFYHRTQAYFQGRIRPGGFRLREVDRPPFRGGSDAVAWGRFIPDAEGTAVKVVIAPGWPTLLYLGAFWYPLWITLTVIAFPWSAMTVKEWLSTLVFITFPLLACPWLFLLPSFWPKVKEYRAQLELLLRDWAP